MEYAAGTRSIKKRLIKAYKGRGKLCPGSISSYGNWYSDKAARGAPPQLVPFRKRNCDAPWQRKGIQGEKGYTTISVFRENARASFFFPPLLRGHRFPRPFIYAPFGQFYSLLVLLQIGLAALDSVYILLLYLSFCLSIYPLSPSFASTFNAPSLSLFPPPSIIASRPAHTRTRLFVICLSPCRHSFPFPRFIISLYYPFSRLFRTSGDGTRRGGKKNRPRVPAVERSFAREDTNFLPLSFLISNNSPEAKTRFSFFQKPNEN